jgi:uncharacterized membrane protein YfcA
MGSTALDYFYMELNLLISEDLGLGHFVGVSFLLLGGGVLHGIFGLGFPLVTTPLLSLFIDVRRVMLLILLPTVSINLISVLKGGDWRQQVRRYFPLALWGILGSAVGSYLLASVDPEPFKLLLAISVLIYLQSARFGDRFAWVKRRQRTAMLVFGLLGGFLAGTVNVMVPALIIFALESGLAMRTMVQVFNFCFLLGKLTQALTFAQVGLLTLPHLYQTIPLAGVTLVGLYIGFELHRRVSPDAYRRVLRILLYAMAGLMVVQGAAELIGLSA